jgi:cytidylate kinase
LEKAKRIRPVVAIDGPAGAGKSTVTRRVAEALGYTMVDTGALYRTVALACRRAGVSFEDQGAVGHVASQLADGSVLSMAQEAGQTRVTLRGEDVSLAIRSQEVGQGASIVSAVPAVRHALLDTQRMLGRDGGVVLEGRDIGSVVFPDAEAKFFLTASVEVRARRRYEELAEKSTPPPIDEVRREVEERDRRDRERPIAPLMQAPDAVLVDSSELSVDEAVEHIVARVREVEAELARRS